MSIAIIGLVSAIVAAGASVVVTAWKFSGRIRTTDASRLWEEATKLRAEYKDDIRDLENKLGACQHAIANLEERNGVIAKKNGELEEKIRHQEETIQHLSQHVDSLTSENQDLHRQNAELQRRVDELEGKTDVQTSH